MTMITMTMITMTMITMTMITMIMIVTVINTFITINVQVCEGAVTKETKRLVQVKKSAGLRNAHHDNCITCTNWDFSPIKIH